MRALMVCGPLAWSGLSVAVSYFAYGWMNICRCIRELGISIVGWMDDWMHGCLDLWVVRNCICNCKCDNLYSTACSKLLLGCFTRNNFHHTVQVLDYKGLNKRGSSPW